MCQSSFGSYNDKYRLFQGAELRGTMPDLKIKYCVPGIPGISGYSLSRSIRSSKLFMASSSSMTEYF
jgi:hypothetical protein